MSQFFGRFLTSDGSTAATTTSTTTTAPYDCSCRLVPALEFKDGRTKAFEAKCQAVDPNKGTDNKPWCYVSKDAAKCPSPDGTGDLGDGPWRFCEKADDTKAITPPAPAATTTTTT